VKKLINKAIPKTVGALLNASSLINSKYAAAKALALFATPRKGLIKEHQEPFLDTAKKSNLTYNGFSIMTYQWKGSGKTILLCHGWESNASRWQNLIMLLQESDHNIIALDAPAHGQSESKQFNAILYSKFINVVSQKFHPDIIIGHSVGGMASVFYQSNYQQKNLKKLVLLGAPSEFEMILKNYITMLGYNSKVEKSLKQLIVDTFGAEPSEFSTAKFASKITVDGLIIHDKKDEIIPFTEAERINKHYKNSQLIETIGHGHSLNHNEVYQHIINFINT
jgi:pimeloyl-ACP methyl ester carboxylesterase